MSSNSAADFVKIHGQEALGEKFMLVEGTTYDVELDKFMPTAELTNENHYETSAKTLENFKKTLETFKKTLRSNRVGEKLDVELKDQYGFEDVMDIATRLKESHEGNGSVSTCMTKIKAAFRYIGKRKGVLANLAKFAPNDSYGVVLCGGFTVILGAIDRADTLREELYAVIAEIPLKMHNVNDMLELHKKGTAKLHKCADAVFVAMFSLLTAVINRLSKGITRKLSGLILNGKEYGKDVKEAKKELDSKLEEFNEEAQVCVQRRLARMEDAVQNMGIAMHKIGSSVIEVKEISVEQNAKLEAQTQQTALAQNALYYLCGASDLFDPKSGTLNVAQAHLKGLLTAPHPTHGPQLARSGLASQNTVKYGQKWLKTAEVSGRDHMTDMNECLQGAHEFNGDDKAQIMSAIQSSEVLAWVQDPRSCLLIIEPESSPEQVVNPVAFLSVLITLEIQNSGGTPIVLAVFCGLRAEQSTEESVSGPLGIVTQLNAQLIKIVLDNDLAVDLSFLKRTNFKRAHEVTKDAFRLFKKLLELVLRAGHTDATIYLVLDGLSSIPGDEEDVHTMVSNILSIGEDVCQEAGIDLKVLISDPIQEVLEDDDLAIDKKLVLSMVGPVTELEVVDPEDLQQDASLAVGLGFRSKRDERRRTTSDSSDDSDSDSDSVSE